MTFEVFQALDQCKSFATMDDHLKQMLSAMPNLRGQEDGARRVLSGLVDRGLLQSADQILDGFSSEPGRRLAPLGPVFVLAEDRPEGLARIIDSLIKSDDPGIDSLPIVVLDGSRSQASREANRRVVELIADAVRGQQPSAGTYGSNAVTASDGSNAGGRRVALSLDQTL